MKMKLSGSGLHVKGVEPDEPTLNGLITYNCPLPLRGMKSFEKAEMRIILSVPGVGPGPGRTLPVTSQLPPVTPAFCTGGARVPLVVKSMIDESYMKSPWKPT